jgi:hypothetical protein
MLNKCKDECHCVDSDIKVKKILLSKDRQINQQITSPENPFIGIGNQQLVYSYELLLINESCDTITDLGIVDTFFGSITSLQLTIGLRIVSCCDNIVIRSLDDIYQEDCPQLLESKSYLPPCSVCKIIVTVILENFKETPVKQIKKLTNTMIVTGKRNNKPIKPIIKSATVTETDIVFLVTTQ